MKVRLCTSKLYNVVTLAIVHEDQVNEMWSEYLKNVDDYDKRLTEGWKDDANGVLVFVSLHLLVPGFHHSDALRDRSLLRSCRVLYHRKLQTLIAESWWPV